MRPIIVVNCGAGSKPDMKNGAEKAGRIGYEILLKSGRAVDAIESAICSMEDDERFNAGTGSKIRLDGSVQMDAAIMESDGNCGAVASIMNVRHPIKVARMVSGTPHILLACKAANQFAAKMGVKEYDTITQRSIEAFKVAKKRLETGDMPKYANKWKDFEKFGMETVGAVARDISGRFATGISTGGTTYQLSGRIGDTPLIGCGFFAGPKGAVSVTGIGEDIMRKVLSKFVYDKIEAGKSAKDAAQLGVDLFEDHIPTGIVAVSADDYGAACNRDMAYWVNEEEGSVK